MNKQFILRASIHLLLLAVFLDFLKAQSPVFAPLGAVWTYNTYNESILKPYGGDQYRYLVTADTVINGWNARVVEGQIWTNGIFVPNSLMKRYVSTIGDKVYHWVDTSFVLLYNFSAQPGDTIYSAVSGSLPFPNLCSEPYGIRTDFGYIIDSLGTINVDGVSLRTQYVRGLDQVFANWNILGIFTGYSNVPLTERIGGVYLGTWFGGNIVCPQSGTYASLRCYRDNDIYFEGFTRGLPCDSVLATATPERSVFNVGPNPFTNEIRIYIPASSHSPLQFTLFDLAGRVIISKAVREGENIVWAPGLPAGFYFWELRWRGALVGSGKVVK